MDKEAEATHHLLRRYRRRVFLIVAGPIWDFWLRHCYYCAVVEVKGSEQAWVRAQVDGRGLGTRCSSVACAISGAEQAALARAREGERGPGGRQRVRECKGGGMAAVETVVKSTWNR